MKFSRLLITAAIIAFSAFVLPMLFGNPTYAAPTTIVPLDRQFIDQSTYPDAQCNDGTPPVYYARPGSGSGVDSWIITLRGGPTCTTEASCSQQALEYRSSTPFMGGANATLALDGILSDDPLDNPDFYNWNHVYLISCTSDSWLGSNDVTFSPTQTMRFHGHDNLYAVIDDLRDPASGENDFDIAEAVIWASVSSSTSGMRNAVDDLSSGARTATHRTVEDAGNAMTVAPPALVELEAKLIERWDAWGPIVDPDCSAANAAEPWWCLYHQTYNDGDYSSTPRFLHQDQGDTLALDSQGLNPANPNHAIWVAQFAAGIRTLIQDADGGFSPSTGRHVKLLSDKFTNVKVNGLSFADVFHNWYFDTGGETNVIEPAVPTAITLSSAETTPSTSSSFLLLALLLLASMPFFIIKKWQRAGAKFGAID